MRNPWTHFLTAARRVSLPVPRTDWVIDVGSGTHPHPRADVACDAYEDDAERTGALRIDRPFVWARADRLPFRDRAFDFSVCSHLLEHVSDPAAVLEELQRVSKAGYIETPSPASEWIIPYTYHRSRCGAEDGVLTVTGKPQWDDTLADPRYSDVLPDLKRLWLTAYDADPRVTLTRFWWRDRIPYRISESPAEMATVPVPFYPPPVRSWLRRVTIGTAYKWYRPRKAGWTDRLACAACRGLLTLGPERATCQRCSRAYPTHRGHWDFRVETS